MDLDALGLNSTFESTELEHSHQPPVDRVDTSEIEGPEDFTMNMTYWMTADLPLAQIKSRKEANTKRPAARMDAIQDSSEGRQATEVGEPIVVVEEPRQRSEERSRAASPTRRADGTPDKRRHSAAVSERSMENDEKVRSFLSNLPDTEMDGALTGTPMHGPRRSFLQVPRSSPPKARSLQPTVEDYDTPRKPTQETVIRHTSAIIDTTEQDVARNKIAELQHQLEQQESSSRSRITELETILSYTRSELESTRAENYKHKEKVSHLEKSMERLGADHDAARAAADVESKSRQRALEAKIRESAEEMRLQNLVKLETMLVGFEHERKDLEESNRQLAEEAKAKGRSLELSEATLLHEREAQQSEKTDGNAEEKRMLLAEQLSSVQARANALQSKLETATAEIESVREKMREKDLVSGAVEATATEQTRRIVKLEGDLQNARFEVQCAKAEAAAKQQLFQTNIELNTRLRTLQSELESARNGSAGQNQRTENNELETRIGSLQSQLDAVRADNAAKDQRLQHTISLETEVQSLRAQIGASSNDRALNDGQSRQGVSLEARIRSLQSQLQSAQSELTAKDKEVARYIEEQEQAEHRISTYQGRLQSLEASNASLRQQLAEAHRESAQARGDAERFERDLEDANDLLKEAQAEADRRVSDIDRKLSKMKELKVEAETKFKELRAQHEDMIEQHDTTMDDVRDKAEDAVRKAGALLEQERSEKRRITRELKRIKEEVETLRNSAAQKVVLEDDADSTLDDNDTTTNSSATATEITSLRSIIRTQLADMKTLRSELVTLRKELKTLKSTRSDSPTSSPSTISTLESTISALRAENASLHSLLATREADYEAVNKAMDEKLAVLLSKLMKEKAKTVVGKRDGQWSESVRELESEREVLGKVVMRQWGREELGAGAGGEEREGKEGKQAYRYKYAKR
jgi:chromosome segregation ATPase